MKTIILVMLIVQAGIFVATAAAILFTPSTAGRPRPIWSTFAISLVVVSGASWNIGNSHAGQPGAEILVYGAPLLLGMGIMAALLLIRHRRGLDRLD
ncbi:MAG TPA: hypothetical protein VMG08_05620 [Allosphingosinicella sp.]|nr:hypothetical protein [Allosphingosinicella sp.]